MIALLLAAAVQIGSKAFTESVILAEIATQECVASGVPAVHRRELGGTRVLFDALVAGQIGAYPEYSGTILQELSPGDESGLDARLAARGIARTASLGFDDTYAIGVRREVARKAAVATISDLARHPELVIGLSNEFLERKDGWPKLRDAYGFRQRDVRGMVHDLAYRALASGAIAATDLYSTDAEIAAYDLVVLRDDRKVFPEYEATFLYRKDLPPDAVAALRRLEGKIDERAMIDMNAQARLRGVPDTQIAADFLRRTLGTSTASPAASDTRGRRIGARTVEHLELVAISLFAGIVVAIPLGILAGKRPRAGQFVIGFASLVQTIPSLALLVFMIPLLGIGEKPAIAALFLYSLLPMVRNTAEGLRGIPADLRDSALALGLPPFARLRLVELPLAFPSILAGVQTSAVIDIGTATLGALIGAGGYGQPILTGIRLADTGLILEGAVPAAALALVAQGIFDAIGRIVIPRGLRL
ncbi:MAG: glycine betaine ABC transporter substrate-binding protein [Myxococcales bacterium]